MLVESLDALVRLIGESLYCNSVDCYESFVLRVRMLWVRVEFKDLHKTFTNSEV